MFDFDTTKRKVIPQLNYIGSQLIDDFTNAPVSLGKSMTDMAKSADRDFAWQSQALTSSRFIPLPQKREKSDHSCYLVRHCSRKQPTSNHLLLDPKPTSLLYCDATPEPLMPSLAKMIPRFGLMMARKVNIPGEVETACLGAQGEGYGLASYTKGQQSS